MVHLILVYVIYALSRVFSGFEDGIVSQNEINCKTSIEPNREWHRMGFIKLILIAIALSLAYTFTWKAALVFVSILNLQVIIFNPIVSTKYLKQGFFYLASNGWDGIFKQNEKLYYLANVLMFALILTYLTITL